MRKRLAFGKRRSPPPVKNIFVITMILFVLMIWLSFVIVDKGIKPTLMDVAETKTTEFATRAINAAVKFAETYEFQDVTDVTQNENGDITSWKFNSAAVNEINRYATDRVEEFFKRMNSGEIPPEEQENLNLDYGDTAEEKSNEDPTVVEIPLGQATGNTIFANLGPKIPVNLELVGNVKTDVVHDIEGFGINSALIKVYIHVEAEVQIVIPFSTGVKEVSTDVYATSGVINLGVPDFYGEGGNNNPSISIPKDDFEKDLQDDK
ncbi:sporulation protein YunB [Lentibacillus sp. Marseille-P4043]|uniref:sporulation protein YunB n=1 Tax=Lentibacillus sp. Marseille-P4043 TaxID=2040293 RepID=UPI001F26B7B7|nr:sporulation protein YunB [Lentibacillus sp. Marseille-P4043]